MTASTYADLEIRILGKAGSRGYPVELKAEGQEFLGGHLCADLLAGWRFDPTDPETSGQALFDLLLADRRVRDGWQRIWGRHERRRVRLRIDETAPELDRLPWEALTYGGLHLAADARTPFSRYLADENPRGEPVSDRLLKLLVAIASPDLSAYPDLAPIDVAREKEILQEALAEVSPAERTVDFLEETVTLPAIGDKLCEGYHILHVIAHGRTNREGDTHLCLAGAGNQPCWVGTGAFVAMLNGLPQKPRLVVLASCQSAARSPTDALRGFAPALVHEAGVPAVLAMQESVAMETAQAFARVFYRELLRHGLVDLASNQARAALLSASLPGSSIPVLYSRLPDNQLFLAAQEPPRAGARPAPFAVPFVRNRDFVGREEDLRRLHEALGGDGRPPGARPVGIRPAVLRPAGVTGMGGIGKTQLAVEYAYRYRDEYPGGVFWVNAAEPLPQGLAALGRHLRPDLTERSLDEQIRAAAEYLRAHPNSLLILDNVADPATLNVPVSAGTLPADLPCRVLFTTRRRDLGRFTAVEVTVLPEEAALQLILRHSERQPMLDPAHPEHRTARAICAQLGRLPLALEIAGAFLGEWPEISLHDLRARLREQGALEALDEEAQELPATSLFQVHDAGLEATLRTQWDAAPDVRARLLLRVMGQLPEAAVVPAARLGLLAGVPDRARPGRPSTLRRTLKRLLNASLVEELQADAVRLHPLVRAFAARRTPPDEQTAFREQCAARLLAAYEDVAVLEEHCARRGVDALEADLRAALALLPSRRPRTVGSADGAQERLSSLLRLLQREAHVLRDWDRGRQPARFGQQVYARALYTELTQLAAAAEARLEAQEWPYLALRWRAGRESRALVRTLTGHVYAVVAVALTPDGARAVSASADGTLKVWDLRTGHEERTLTGHKQNVTALAVTPDGSCALSASWDCTLKVRNLATGQELRTLTGHEKWVNAAAVTPEGRRAVSASNDRTLKVWDLDSGQELRTLTGHEASVCAVAVTPDGQYAISASDDRTLKVWNLDTGQEVRTLTGHEASVLAVAVTPDGRRAISASADRTLKAWNLDTGQEERTLVGHTKSVNAVAVTPDGRRVVSASDDRTLKVWDLETGQKECTLTGHAEWVQDVAVTPDGRRAVSASSDRTLKVWDLPASQAQRAREGAPSGHEGWVLAVAVTPDGRWAVSTSYDHTLKIWDIHTGQQVRTLTGHTDWVQAIAVTPDGQRAVSASKDGTLKVWDLETGQEIRTLFGHKRWVTGVAVTPDGHRIISASYDRTLRIWDLSAGQEICTLTGHEDWVRAVAVTPDGRRAISASDDRTLKVWDLDNGEQSLRLPRTLTGHEAPVRAVAVTPDGRRAISASDDRTLKVWDLDSGEQSLRLPRTLTGHKAPVRAVAVTPDGRRAISASDDRTLVVWDLETSQELASIALEGAVYCVAVHPDGATLVTGDEAGNVYGLRYVEGGGESLIH
jgi:WD40 repeat protein